MVFAHDITEWKLLQRQMQEAEAQARQKQKLESIGTLAGGVAHEINNPITGIINYAQLILDIVEPESQQAEYAGEIIQESQRISEIVRNLLQFLTAGKTIPQLCQCLTILSTGPSRSSERSSAKTISTSSWSWMTACLTSNVAASRFSRSS